MYVCIQYTCNDPIHKRCVGVTPSGCSGLRSVFTADVYRLGLRQLGLAPVDRGYGSWLGLATRHFKKLGLRRLGYLQLPGSVLWLRIGVHVAARGRSRYPEGCAAARATGNRKFPPKLVPSFTRSFPLINYCPGRPDPWHTGRVDPLLLLPGRAWIYIVWACDGPGLKKYKPTSGSE